MATTGVSASEAQARRHSATGSGLTTDAFSVTRARAAPPEAGDGQTPIPSGALFGDGGNLLHGHFHDPQPGQSTSLGVTFVCPGLTGGATLDFGDGSDPVELGSIARAVEHTYAALPDGVTNVVFDATIRDEHARLRGWVRFRLPRFDIGPRDIRSGHPASTVV
jgi:hypothetical protein